MEKHTNSPDTDITQERYKGPSATIAALGEGAWAHWAWLMAGVAGGGITSVLFHEKVNLGVEKWRGLANRWVEKGPIRAKLGAFSNWLIGNGKDEYQSVVAHTQHTLGADKARPVELFAESQKNGFVHNISHHLLSMFEWFGKAVGKESTITKASPKLDAFIIGGGITGLLGGIGSTFIYGNKGWKNSRAGRDQFDRAKEEILATREELNAARQQYAQAKGELDHLQNGVTAPDVKITPDATPAPLPVIDPPAPLAQFAPDSPTEITPPHIEGPVIAPAPTTGRVLPRDAKDSPTTITPPKIKEPVIGPEHAARAESHSKGDREWAQHVQETSLQQDLQLHH